MLNSFNLDQTPPQQPQQQQSVQQPDPEHVAQGHRALEATMAGLIKLVSKPTGDLTKKDVFDAASDMIAHGAFPDPESKQQLIGELAQLPDDEAGIRKLLGQYLLQVAMVQDHYHSAVGPPVQNEVTPHAV